MGLGDFLQDQVNSKIQDVRENKHAEKEREMENERADKERELERKAQLQDEYRGHVKGLAEEYQAEVQVAKDKADEIFNMPMPENEQEFVKMLMECGRNVDKPVTESALAVKMAGYEDISRESHEYIDFELPSQTIHDAWDLRLESLISYGKTAFSGNTKIESLISEYSQKTEKSKEKAENKHTLKVLGIIGAVIAVLIIIGYALS